MTEPTVRIAVDTTMPQGRCVVMVDGDIVYAGRLGLPTIRFLQMEGALVLLSPEDFADGAAFVKAYQNLH